MAQKVCGLPRIALVRSQRCGALLAERVTAVCFTRRGILAQSQPWLANRAGLRLTTHCCRRVGPHGVRNPWHPHKTRDWTKEPQMTPASDAAAAANGGPLAYGEDGLSVRTATAAEQLT